MPTNETLMKAALQRAAQALQAAANTITPVAAPPVIVPPPPVVVPPPPVVTSGRQKALAWMGVIDLNALEGNDAGGVTMTDLQSVFSGVVVSLQDDAAIPSWMESQWLTADRTGDLYLSTYVAASHDPLPRTQTEWDAKLSAQSARAVVAKRAKAEGGGIDCEPYGIPDSAGNPWSERDRALTRANAKRLGAIWREVGENFIVYPSSRASWPGSYNDLLYIQNGDTTGTSYGANVFPDFIDGLIDGGLRPTILDATFHIGVQLHVDGGWDAGIAHSVALTHQRFPQAFAAPMIWPDIDEGGRAFFTPDQVGGIARAASKNSSGPFAVYQHNMATGAQVAYWRAVFAAIKAGLAQ